MPRRSWWIALALALLLLPAGCGEVPAGVPPGSTPYPPTPYQEPYPVLPTLTPEPTLIPLPTMTPWPTLPTTPTPPLPTRPTEPPTPVLPFPTPALPPAPPGPPPAGLGTIWYPYQAGPDSRPMLQAVLVDDQGRRWGELGASIDLGLEPGPFGADLRRAYASPDGQTFIVDVGHAEESTSYLVDPRSPEATPLATDPEHQDFLAWAPDRQIFVWDSLSRREIWLWNMDTREHRVIDVPSEPGCQGNHAVAVSPDGTAIADVTVCGPTVAHPGSEVEIALRPFAGGSRSTLASITVSPTAADPNGNAYVPEYGLTWSPDGRKMALVLIAEGSGHLWIVDGETGQAGAMAQELSWYHPATWSPDGRYIAIVRASEPSHVRSPADLWLFDLATSSGIQVTRFGGQRVTSVVWSPDGQRLAFAVTRSDYGEVWVTSVDGTQQYPVAGPTAPDAPIVWLPATEGGQ